MKAIRETIGNTEVLIQSMNDDELEIVNESGVIETGVGDELNGVYIKAKNVIKSIAEDMGQELESIRKKAHISQMEMEFSLGFSAETKTLLLFGAKTDSGLKIKLVWQADQS